MKKLYIVLVCVLASGICMLGCKKKDGDKEPKSAEDIAKKVEKVAMNYAKTDEDLGAYDSIKFVGYMPLYKHVYCDYMVKVLSRMNDDVTPQLDSAVTSKDMNLLDSLSVQVDKIQQAMDFYNKQAHNILAAKDDPIVAYEAKCYSYTDGYLQEAVYFISKDWKVFPLNPFDFTLLK